MSETAQNLKNHAKIDPAYHYFLLPVMGINFFNAAWVAFRDPRFWTLWLVVLSAAAIVAVLKIRTYPLKVQDRLIRLEERMRLAAVLPENLRGQIAKLTERQLVALRFASDAELPGLVQQALDTPLTGAEIKKNITNWRGDYFRV